MSTRLKKLLAGVMCGLLSLILGFVIVPQFNASTREVTIIPMLVKSVTEGSLIQDSNIKMVEVGKYNLPASVIHDRDKLINTYAARDIAADRFLYEDDISRKEIKTSLIHKIRNGGVSIQTDLAKCVGGIPKPGDYVKVYVVTRDETAKIMKSTLYKALVQVEVLDVLNTNGLQIAKVSGTGTFSTQGKETTPAYIVLNTQYNLQEQLLIEGSYNGAIHLSLINPDNVDKSLINIDISKISELEKEGSKILTSTMIRVPSIAADNEETTDNSKNGSSQNIDSKSNVQIPVSGAQNPGKTDNGSGKETAKSEKGQNNESTTGGFKIE